VADLYAQGRSLRQIGSELGVPWTAVGHQLRRAGVIMRLELRDRGVTWNEVAKEVDMTVSGTSGMSRSATSLRP
jgi:hypothetical protein